MCSAVITNNLKNAANQRLIGHLCLSDENMGYLIGQCHKVKGVASGQKRCELKIVCTGFAIGLNYGIEPEDLISILHQIATIGA